MPYFRKEADGQVVYRKHEFNSESLNGEIRKIEDSADCLLLAHAATKKFNWVVSPIENIGPQEGLEKLSELGTKDTAKKGQPFYSLVHSSYLQDYLNFHKEYDFKERDLEASPEEPKKKVVEKEPVKEIERRSPDKVEKVEGENTNKKNRQDQLIYKPTLVRDVRGEKPIKISS